MATQHPDNSSQPFWHNDSFVSTYEETKELFINFSELGIEEYKWDWEGKLVDESIIERLFQEYYEYFKANQIGLDKFLTYRIPNPTQESDFRLGRAFMGLLSASATAKMAGLHNPPMFELILPMTDSAKLLIDIQEAFREVAGLKHWIFNVQRSGLEHVQMIPLFEQIEVIMNADQILSEYLKLHQDRFGFKPKYLRPYIARSDPALNSGHPATVLAVKIGLSNFKKLEEQIQIPLYPILGCAALPFRGGLSPINVPQFVDEYAGIKTVTIQSAFRYDYTKDQAIEGIKQLNELLPVSQTRVILPEVETKLVQIIKIFEGFYQNSIEEIAWIINKTADFFPKRRERVQHTGLFGYSRGVGEVKLPRAIKFTGSLYSIGLPPELVGMGRSLQVLKDRELLELFTQTYINLISDYTKILSYTNLKNIEKLSQKYPVFEDILMDIELTFSILNIPKNFTDDQYLEYQDLTSTILDEVLLDNPDSGLLKKLITKTGQIRKSLG